MNRDIFKSGIDDIKASEEFKKKTASLMLKKYNSKKRVQKYFKRFIAAASLLVISVVIITFSLKFLNKSAGCSINPKAIKYMFTYNGRMYYINYKNNLYLFDSSSGAGKKQFKINNAKSWAFENGYIYYSDGSSIYEKNLSDGTLRKLLKGQYLGIDAVNGSRLFYSIAYKNKNGGFSESEYHIYDLLSEKDTVLFKRSNNMWYIYGIEGDTAVADAYMPTVVNNTVVKDDAGIFIIDLKMGTYKKISDMQTHTGCIAGDVFYFMNQSGQLYSISLDSSISKQLLLPGSDKKGYWVDSIISYGDTLYAGVHYITGWHYTNLNNGQIIYDERTYIASMNLKTGKTSILADASNRIYMLCTDGKTLYAYNAEYPNNNKGYIKVIKLK